MKTEQLNKLLNTACEIITALEGHADSELQKEIDAFFDEINYSDKLDDEMTLIQSANDEVQDWDTFGKKKI
jgi:hypothetical protein